MHAYASTLCTCVSLIMCVYFYMCKYVCRYACVFEYAYVYECIRTYVYRHAALYMCMDVYLRVCVCVQGTEKNGQLGVGCV